MGAICWGLVINRWATIYEIGVDQKIYATALGLVSVTAFSPDVWFWQFHSFLLDKYKVETEISGIYNYQIVYQYSMILIVIGRVIGIVAGLVLMYTLRKEKNKKRDCQIIEWIYFWKLFNIAFYFIIIL
ncbi:hypothetical protein [Spiroplasma floricola]|uniref:MFS transporter n=1 Tax=Spiroplasma floricola 23-6 TaxID=1336749 RepID=A0A2K8SF72_9MOLU|nr:hypothetical protein [Spiroplasma floricola]AUB32117.1 MFS transporter [Spiroplasma floricola 23-6]